MLLTGSSAWSLQGVLAATQSPGLLLWAPPSSSQGWDTVHWVQVTSSSPSRAGFPLCVQGRQEQGSHTIPRGLEGPSRRTDSCFSSPSLTFQENPSYKGDVAEPKAAPTVSRTAAAAAPTTPALSHALKAEKYPQTEPSEGTTAEFVPWCQPSIPCPALRAVSCP